MKRDDLEAFFAEPTAENYLRVQRRVRRYRRPPHADQIARVESLFDARAFANVRTEVDKLLPHWMLSPRLYRLSGLAAWELRDLEAAQIDRFLYEACLLGLQATGNGAPDAPYLVTYASDIDELLAHMGLRAASRRLVRGPVGLCEAVGCDDGREHWFARTAVDLPAEIVATSSAETPPAAAAARPAGRTRRRAVSAR